MVKEETYYATVHNHNACFSVAVKICHLLEYSEISGKYKFRKKSECSGKYIAIKGQL